MSKTRKAATKMTALLAWLGCVVITGSPRQISWYCAGAGALRCAADFFCASAVGPAFALNTCTAL